MLELENSSTRVTNHSISVYNNLAREALSQGIVSWQDTFTIVAMFNDPEFPASKKKSLGELHWY